MERIKLTQWRVKVNGKDRHFFTPFIVGSGFRIDERKIAIAIAVSMYGEGVEEVEDEGLTHQDLTAQQMHVADPRFCPACEGWDAAHGLGCEYAEDSARDAAELAGDCARDEA